MLFSSSTFESYAQRGGRFISAPVFGRPESAAAASLSIVAAGPADAIDRVSIIFTAIGKKVLIAGEEPFHANALKLCGNFLLLTTIEGLPRLRIGSSRAITSGVSETSLIACRGFYFLVALLLHFL